MNTNITPKMEIVVTTPDKLGVLSRITTVITDSRVNILAICGYATDGTGHVRLITDDNKKAGEALNRACFEAKEHSIVIAEVSPHRIHPEVATLAGGIDVVNNYWCASAHTGEHAVIVFSPEENYRKNSPVD